MIHLIKIKKSIFSIIPILLLFSCNNTDQNKTNPNISLFETDKTEHRIAQIIDQMTLKEKAGQMINIGLPAVLKGEYWGKRDTAFFDSAKFKYNIIDNSVGSIHNTPRYPATPEEWYKIIKTIQDSAVNSTRLGIPILYGLDNIHGANYVNGSVLFPHQIAIAATWNTELSETCGEITSYESRAASIPWNFNPNADIAPNPLWGRISESFGEDPYLVSKMTSAYLQGSQKNGLQDSQSSAVCLKHYLGYGAGKNGKDRANAIIPENNLRQYFLPPFQKAIENGAMGVMISSNAVNGLPCHINKYYITDILKGELGFNGVVISDFSDVDFLVSAHLSAKDKIEATKLAINAGLDLIMNPYNTNIVDQIVELVENGEVPMSRIDDAVTRVLRLKFYLNLFERPYYDYRDYVDFGSKKHIALNYKSACEAITLLKNKNDILPLKKNKKVLVTGYTANSINLLNGAWSRSFSGRDTLYNDPTKKTILDAIRDQVGAENVDYVEGTDYLKDINSDKAVLKAKNSDYIVVCVGEITASEKPSDINELPLPEVQQKLVKELSKTKKPIILVMVQGRPRIINQIEPLADAILMAYYPGQEGGRAIADIVFGDVNPSGKLPYTYPKYTGNILTYYHKKTDIRDTSWKYNGFYRQYDFGYGLSYTEFVYSNLKISTDTLTGDDNLKISIDVTNVGKIPGKEITEVFLKDLVATLSPDSKRLVRFTKTSLAADETKTIDFEINKEDLSHVDFYNNWITEEGNFELQVGGNPTFLKTIRFYYTN